MIARVLLGQRATAKMAAGLLVGTISFYPTVALAESPAERQQFKKKSIYDDYDEVPLAAVAKPSTPPGTTTVTQTSSTPAAPTASTEASALVPSAAGPATQPEQRLPQHHPRGPTPTDRLASQIRRARLFLHSQAAAAEDSVNAAMDRVFDLEQSFTSTLASLAPPRESGERLMPGLIYVLVASMAGSIVSRRRNVVLRAATPLAFGVAAGWAVLPLTMRNVGDLAWKYEQRLPVVRDAHLQTREGIERGIRFVKVHSELGKQMVEDKVTSAREAVEGWVRKGK